MKNKWVAFYSQTGSEIKEMMALGYIPDVVVTDNFCSYLANYEFFKESNVKQKIRAVKNTKQSKIDIYCDLLDGAGLVTLHGWLNIVPGDICEQYNIYNGHPGHIIEYPELKGKDPQERVYDDLSSYDKIGSVVHRVTEEVDGGEIVAVAEAMIESREKIASLDNVFNINRNLSIHAWLDFFRNIDIITEDELNYNGTLKRDRRKMVPVTFIK